jgi:hypothetical protein
MKRLFVFALLFLLAGGSLSSSARAQTDCKTVLGRDLAEAHNGKPLALDQFLSFTSASDCMSRLIVLASKPTEVQSAAIKQALLYAKRAFQQNGASVGSGGSTNLVSKGATAKALAVAAEYGALTESVSGGTVTVQGQLGGLADALLQNGVTPNCAGILRGVTTCVSSTVLNKLNRFSYSVAFDVSPSSQTTSGTATSTSTSTAQPVNFTVTTHSVSSVTGKLALIRGAAASGTDIQSKLNNIAASLPKNSADLQASAQALWKLRLTDAAWCPADVQATNAHLADGQKIACDRPEMQTWTIGTRDLVLAAANLDDAYAQWESRATALLLAFRAGQTDPNFDQELTGATAAYAINISAYQAGEDKYFESLRKDPVLSVEYDYNRPASAPSNSTFRLIYGQNVGKTLTLTANGAASIYNSQPSSAIPGASLLRDVQIAGEASYDFSKGKKLSLIGNSLASAAYYFQDQTSPAILNVTPGTPVSGVTFVGLPSSATQVYGQTGKVHIVQGRFTYTPGTSGVSIPISISWSNRTELVVNANSIWRGQVGISYDFDSLFSGLGK